MVMVPYQSSEDCKSVRYYATVTILPSQPTIRTMNDFVLICDRRICFVPVYSQCCQLKCFYHLKPRFSEKKIAY